jgi:CHAT domain-containing protein
MEDGTLLGDHYTFVRLSSAREVVRNTVRPNIDVATKKTNAILYGGLKYDLAADVMKREAVKYDITSLLATRGDILRGDSVYRELPETKKEIEGIESVLKSQRLAVTPYTGIQGTEESFLNMSGNAPQILHIATHGFYYTPDAAQKIDYLKGYTDAMTLSGLVMSGGNAAWLGKELPQGVLGGILTAVNISRLDLSSIQMAVLSACQTGQGMATPEGLFGLQRAFKKAGVQTIVMSLWNISDIVTRDFMVKFYENLVLHKWDKHKAFHETKKYLRTETEYKDPYYWAGFVMLD